MEVYERRTGTIFAVLILSLFFFFGNLAALFDQDVLETANVTLSFDVAGSAYVTPYVLFPEGSHLYQPSVLLTNVTGYTFSPFTFDHPFCGIYTVGALVYAQSDGCSVSINTNNTVMSNSVMTLVLRPALSDMLTVSPNNGERTLVFTNVTYVPVDPGVS